MMDMWVQGNRERCLLTRSEPVIGSDGACARDVAPLAATEALLALVSVKGGVGARRSGWHGAPRRAATELLLDFVIEGPLLGALLLCVLETLSGAEREGNDAGDGGCLVTSAGVEGGLDGASFEGLGDFDVGQRGVGVEVLHGIVEDVSIMRENAS
jgi:hypothetical protein